MLAAKASPPPFMNCVSWVEPEFYDPNKTILIDGKEHQIKMVIDWKDGRQTKNFRLRLVSWNNVSLKEIDC